VSNLPDFPDLVIERRDRIARITFNRPEVYNALPHQGIDDFLLALRLLDEQDDTDVIVVTGAGRAFMSGIDVNYLPKSTDDPRVERRKGKLWGQGQRGLLTLLQLEKPTIAMVNGPAAGLGSIIATCCDFAIMSEDATIGDRHINIGLVPGDGGTTLWPLLVGPSQAKYLLMTGKMLSGRQAADLGLVLKAVPAQELEAATQQLADELMAQPRLAVRFTKFAINRQFRAAYENVQDVASFLEVITQSSDEHFAAVEEFKERRSAARSAKQS